MLRSIVLSRGEDEKLVKDVPDVALMEGALRDAFFLPLPGRIVSVLALTRRVPPWSVRPEAARSDGGPSVDWGMELTVSVSTVIFFVVGSTPDFGFKLLNEPRGATVLALGVLSGSISSLCGRSWSLPLSPVFEALGNAGCGVDDPDLSA